MEFAQGQTLGALLETKKSRWRQAGFLRESFEGHLAPFLLQKRAELLVQRGIHPKIFSQNAFRIRNVFIDHGVLPDLAYGCPVQPDGLESMTCSECHNTVSEDTETCPHCGAPIDTLFVEDSEAERLKGYPTGSSKPQPMEPVRTVIPPEIPHDYQPHAIEPSVPAVNSQEEPAKDALSVGPPKLWNPIVIWILTPFLLTPLVATCMVSMNWLQLGRRKPAIFTWLFMPGYFLLMWLLRVDFNFWVQIGIGCLAVLLFLCIPQNHYLKGNRIAATRRRWVLPIAIGIAVQALGPMLLGKLDLLLADNSPAATMERFTQSAFVSTKEPSLLTVEELVKLHGPSVFPVAVSWEKDVPYLLFFTETTKGGTTGSAVVFGGKPGSLFLFTNRHVVDVPEGAKNVVRTVYYEGETLPLTILAYGKDNLDLAFVEITSEKLKIDGNIQHLRGVKDVNVGEECVAIGNTMGIGISVTSGIVSRFDDLGNYVAIRTSAPISPGNSGGALFSRRGGHLIGITTSSLSGLDAQNVNFAIPIDYIREKENWNWVGPGAANP